MLSMNPLRLLAFAFLVAMLCGATALGATNNSTEPIERMIEAARKGPAELLAHVRETKTPSPLIYSQWYVDRLAAKDPQRGKTEQAHREFGRVVLQSLEALAPTLTAPADTQTRQATAVMLLDLADWFGEPSGYGNAFIFIRLQDLATVPLAYLIADLSYPEASLTTMVGRLVEYPDEVKRHVRALNVEAPEPIFEVPTGIRSCAGVWRSEERNKLADRIVGPLERTWLSKLGEVRAWQQEHKTRAKRPTGKESRDELPESLAFFVDDDFSVGPGGATTLSEWDKKRHQRLWVGLTNWNIRHVKGFLLFRQKIGGFPTTPPSWWKPDDSAPSQTPA